MKIRIPSMKKVNLINLHENHDLDLQMFRVFSLTEIKTALEKHCLTLVGPALWNDPWENFILHTQIRFKNESCPKQFPFHLNLYAQCWTEIEESDAMWRIYSNGSPKFKVQTTVGKLFALLKKASDLSNSSTTYFIGRVRYQTEKQLTAHLKSLVQLKNLTKKSRSIPGSLLKKPKEFKYEKEIRLIAHDTEATLAAPVLNLKINPNSLFDKVVIDPRLNEKEYLKYSENLRALGFENDIEASAYYKIPSTDGFPWE